MRRCAACGRRLRVPSPSGLGPVCARRLGVTVDRPARASPPPNVAPVPHVPGQLAIPITNQRALEEPDVVPEPA